MIEFPVATILKDEQDEIHVVIVDDRIGKDLSTLQEEARSYIEKRANAQGLNGPVAIAWFIEQEKYHYRCPVGLESFFEGDSATLPETIKRVLHEYPKNVQIDLEDLGNNI